LVDQVGLGDIIFIQLSRSFRLIDLLHVQVHVTSTLKIPYSKENFGAKAALLSGPPGIGVYVYIRVRV